MVEFIPRSRLSVPDSISQISPAEFSDAQTRSIVILRSLLTFPISCLVCAFHMFLVCAHHLRMYIKSPEHVCMSIRKGQREVDAPVGFENGSGRDIHRERETEHWAWNNGCFACVCYNTRNAAMRASNARTEDINRARFHIFGRALLFSGVLAGWLHTWGCCLHGNSVSLKPHALSAPFARYTFTCFVPESMHGTSKICMSEVAARHASANTSMLMRWWNGQCFDVLCGACRVAESSEPTPSVVKHILGQRKGITDALSHLYQNIHASVWQGEQVCFIIMLGEQLAKAGPNWRGWKLFCHHNLQSHMTIG